MKIRPFLKEKLKNIFRNNPEVLDLFMDAATDVILEKTDARYDLMMAEEMGDELKEMILNPEV